MVSVPLPYKDKAVEHPYYIIYNTENTSEWQCNDHVASTRETRAVPTFPIRVIYPYNCQVQTLSACRHGLATTNESVSAPPCRMGREGWRHNLCTAGSRVARRAKTHIWRTCGTSSPHITRRLCQAMHREQGKNKKKNAVPRLRADFLAERESKPQRDL